MVGERAARQPVLPVMGRPHQASIRVVGGPRNLRPLPRQRAEARLSLLDHGAGQRARPLEADVHVARQHELNVAALALAAALAVAILGVRPRPKAAPVVEHRLAVQGELHLAVHTAHHAQEDVARVVVGGWPSLRLGPRAGVAPRADEQHVAHDHPAGGGAPARLEHHRARQVSPRRGHGDVGWAEAKAAGVAIEDGAEDARGVDARQAQPLDVAGRGDQRRRLAVGQKSVLADRREGRAHEPVVHRRRRCPEPAAVSIPAAVHRSRSREGATVSHVRRASPTPPEVLRCRPRRYRTRPDRRTPALG